MFNSSIYSGWILGGYILAPIGDDGCWGYNACDIIVSFAESVVTECYGSK